MIKLARISFAAVLLAATGAAPAGSVGAGPGGTGSMAVGTITASHSQMAALFEGVAPGRKATIALNADQVNIVGSALDGQPGTVAKGSTLTAPVAFADGTRGEITLDTAAATLTVSRY